MISGLSALDVSAPYKALLPTVIRRMYTLATWPPAQVPHRPPPLPNRPELRACSLSMHTPTGSYFEVRKRGSGYKQNMGSFLWLKPCLEFMQFGRECRSSFIASVGKVHPEIWTNLKVNGRRPDTRTFMTRPPTPALVCDNFSTIS